MLVSVFMDHVITEDKYRGLYYAHTVVLYKRSIALYVKSLLCRVLEI